MGWQELAELEEGRTAEVLIGMKGGMENRNRTKYRKPRKSSDESEPEEVRSESSSAEEMDGKKAQEAFEKMAT